MRRKNDILLKSAFEEAFADLLRFFFKEADTLFDLDRGFEFLDKELAELFPELEKKGGSRLVDMLVKAYAKDGSEKWMLLHIEIQAQHDRDFNKRMFQYFYRIYDRYDVPITALAVFTGKRPVIKEPVFDYQFLGTEIHYKFNSYHILDHSEEQLLVMNNPFALIILAVQKSLLADKIPQQQLADHRMTIIKALIESKKYNNEQISRFLFFLTTFIYIDNPEINSNFEKQFELLTGIKNVMGIIETVKMITFEEGIEKGREEEKLLFVENLLLNTDFDSSKIAALAGVTESFVQILESKIRH